MGGGSPPAPSGPPPGVRVSRSGQSRGTADYLHRTRLGWTDSATCTSIVNHLLLSREDLGRSDGLGVEKAPDLGSRDTGRAMALSPVRRRFLRRGKFASSFGTLARAKPLRQRFGYLRGPIRSPSRRTAPSSSAVALRDDERVGSCDGTTHGHLFAFPETRKRHGR